MLSTSKAQILSLIDLALSQCKTKLQKDFVSTSPSNVIRQSPLEQYFEVLISGRDRLAALLQKDLDKQASELKDLELRQIEMVDIIKSLNVDKSSVIRKDTQPRPFSNPTNQCNETTPFCLEQFGRESSSYKKFQWPPLNASSEPLKSVTKIRVAHPRNSPIA